MASEDYDNLYFTEEKIRLTILTNICRMWVTRGYMDINKYKPQILEDGTVTLKGKSIVEQVSQTDHIDNSSFLPFIGTRVDNNTYIIPLDTPYIKQKDQIAGFDSTKVIVKLIQQTFKDVGNSPIINEFLSTYEKNHKIIVFDGMADKVYFVLSKKKNVEAFDAHFFMLDLMSYEAAPIACSLVTIDDIKYILNPKLPKIFKTDPLVRYYNGDKGDILRIVRPSINNSVEIGYRRIIMR
jgi:hypothetical protein